VFPSHRHVAAYLDAFADDFGIRPLIRFNTAVTAVEPADGSWQVETAGGTETFDAVVIASGHQGAPASPEWSARFEGEHLHSGSYRRPQEFEGKQVLVVGVGNSGLDIAADLAPFAASTTTSARSPVLIMPRMILGVPAARVLGKLIRPWLPWPAQRQIMRVISRIYHGHMEQWGFRTPTTRTHPAGNATFMAHVAYGRIGVRPGVREVDGKTVTFDDGSTLEPDVIISATGYQIDLPFLPAAITPVRERRLEAYRRVVHPDWRGLYFVGFFNVSGGANISMMDVQSSYVTALIDGRARLPSPEAMRADIEAEKAYNARQFPGAARYGLELDPTRYTKQIAESMAR
jgi:cation diffusion facilitator CzcD-associated flavoprotein CzcO